MIAKVFGSERSREQIKNKFRKEEKRDKKMIDRLLENRDKVTIAEFVKKYGPVQMQGEGDQEGSESSLGSESSFSSSSESSSEEESGTSESVE